MLSKVSLKNKKNNNHYNHVLTFFILYFIDIIIAVLNTKILYLDMFKLDIFLYYSDISELIIYIYI